MAYYQKPEQISKVTRLQIDAYTEIARREGVAWAQ